jgi:hypothetical protein
LVEREALSISKLVRGILRVLPLLALLLLGATFAIPAGLKEPLPKSTRKLVIDTGLPVTMAKCAPCHRNLERWNNPKLVNFSHQIHFKQGIKCYSCHLEFPHQKSKTIKPTMDRCVNCHRLTHGNQGVKAPGNCDLCHPSDFNLIPDDHTDSFKRITHKYAARKSRNQSCLVCHKGSFCQNCHNSKNIPSPDAAYKFYPVWRYSGKTTGKKFLIGATPIKMSMCNTCHTDLQQWKNPKLINFNHPVHFKRGIRCKVCHDRWPHQPDKVVKPKMYACAQCHRLSHGNQGLKAPGDCSLCHPSTMNLKPVFHTTEFVGGGHKDYAKADRGLCRLCHRQGFCDSCHNIEIPHPPGWRSKHGSVANSPSAYNKKGEFICFRCHKPEGPKFSYQKAPSCAKCHKAVVFPHQKPWAPVHGKKAEKLGRDVCFTCHTEKRFCNGCHNGIKMPHDLKTWIGKHRLYLRNRSEQVCFRCHQLSQCLLCHATHKVHNQHEIYDFSPLNKGERIGPKL